MQITAAFKHSGGARARLTSKKRDTQGFSLRRHRFDDFFTALSPTPIAILRASGEIALTEMDLTSIWRVS
jgi:hypothetical protein